MKNLLLIFFLVTALSCAQESPREQAEGSIQGININIDYGSPKVKGRTIWGGLEQYGNVWRAGANGNTTIEFSDNVIVGGKKLKAGKYGFFIIPNKDTDWIVIFNSKNDAWGAFSYNENEDVLRIKVKPDFVKENQESLKYSVGKNAIDFAWEKVRIAIPIKPAQ